METYHLTWASDGRRPMFPDEALRRRVLLTLTRVAGRELVLFYLADEHLHAVLAADRARAGRLAQAVFLALNPLLPVPLEPARIRPVEGRSHLEWLVRYVLTQGEHHGLAHHPALWSGSCFQDLVGARYLEGLSFQLARHLPRFRLRDALSIVGLPRSPIVPASDEAIFAAGVVRLAAAGTSAASVGPVLRGSSSTVVRVRIAAVHVGRAAGFSTADLAHVLGVTPRSVRYHRRADACRPLMRAIRIRLALEDAVERPESR